MKLIRSILLLAATALLVISCHSLSVTSTDRMVAASNQSGIVTNTLKSASIRRTGAQKRWGESYLRQKQDWYASVEARDVAENVLQYQTDAGAWPKNTDLTAKPRSDRYLQEIRTGDRVNTIDNGGTTMPMQFLALMFQATSDARYRAAFERGFDYLLAAQYPNGGWPQYFPLRDHGYYSHITYNDNAMMNVMFVLRDVATGKTPFAFVDDTRRGKAAAAVAKGLDCILRTQVKQGGRLTVWCAQYDEITLEPAWARNFEPPSLSGDESVAIVRFLMEVEQPNPKIIAAVEGAVAWFQVVAISGLRYHRGIAADGQRDGWVEVDTNAEPLWARFYELGSNRPIFIGRDKAVHYSYDQIERERRGGYDYYGNWPAELLATDYPRWLAAHHRNSVSAGLKSAPQAAGE